MFRQRVRLPVIILNCIPDAEVILAIPLKEQIASGVENCGFVF